MDRKKISKLKVVKLIEVLIIFSECLESGKKHFYPHFLFMKYTQRKTKIVIRFGIISSLNIRENKFRR